MPKFLLAPLIKPASMLRFLSWFIRGISVLYITLGIALVSPLGDVLSEVFYFLASVLPITFFGSIGILTDPLGSGLLLLPVLGLIAIALGIVALRSGILIRRGEKRGMVIYTLVVLSLMVGLILDLILSSRTSILDPSGPVHVQPAAFLFFVFLISVVLGWREFYALKHQRQ